jgi:hypothetical protein
MSAIEALRVAHAEGVRVSLAGDFIRYRSHGPPPDGVLRALKAEKPAIVALLKAYALDRTAALVGEADGLLARLTKLGFRVRRYGDQAALDDETGQGRVPPMPLLYEFADHQREYGAVLCALQAADKYQGPSR